jgi:hypothetical protein
VFLHTNQILNQQPFVSFQTQPNSIYAPSGSNLKLEAQGGAGVLSIAAAHVILIVDPIANFAFKILSKNSIFCKDEK